MTQQNNFAAGSSAQPAKKDGLGAGFRSFKTSIVLASLSGLFLLVLFWQSVIVYVYAGQQGVYWSRFLGGTSDMVLGEGAHLKFPWDDIYIYDVRLSAIHQTTMLLGKDGMEMKIRWSVRFRPIYKRLPELHQTIGPDYAEKAIVPGIISSLRQILGNYTAEEIYAYDEQALLGELETHVEKHFTNYPIYIKNLLILELQLPKEMEDGIVNKLLQKQQMLSYEFRQKSQELEKKRLKTEAEGIKQFEETSDISILKWKGIQATVELAKSPNSKIIVIGTNAQSLPLLLNTDK